MMSLVVAFFASLTGSAHCIGMCGPFAVAINAGAGDGLDRLLRQIMFTLGRLFTYASLGVFAGAAGLYFQTGQTLVSAAAWLSIVAGLILLYEGLRTSGLRLFKFLDTSTLPCLMGSFFATAMRSTSRFQVFLSGMLAALMPCGLVYGFVALAASSTSITFGAVLMLCFGLGTAPLMIIFGLTSSWIQQSWRLQLHRLSGWMLAATGGFAIVRGLGFCEIPGWLEPVGCPLFQ